MPREAPLHATPLAPIPAGGGGEWFDGQGGARLRAALFAPTGAAAGSVVVSPGRSEPIEKYFEVCRRLTERGFTVLVHDWRGQGLSDRPGRAAGGDARGWRTFVADFGRLLDAFETRMPKPRLALSHSMGGCLALLALAEGEDRFAGAIFSAPMFGIATGGIPKPVAWALAAAMTAVGLGSRPATAEETAPEPFETNVLTHDAARYARNLDQVARFPELRVGPPTFGWVDFALSAGQRLERRADRVAIPVTVVAAGEEKVVDNAATARIAARIPGARLLVLDGAAHEILQETDALQARFWAEFDDLSARVGDGPEHRPG